MRRPGADPVLNQNNEPEPRQPKADGSFVVENVLPGDYRLSFVGLPEGFYVKEARLSGVDALTTLLRYGGPDSGSLDILISPNTGTINGTASPGAEVVLIPFQNRERTELFKPVTADSAGRFTISAIAPGDYILAAWETLDPYAFFGRDVMQQAETGGVRIRVLESSTQATDLVPIRRN